MENYDLVIIGSGPAGYVGAIRGAQLGARVCVIEKGLLGGVCLNLGCIPTKTLVRTAELLRLARSGEEFGVVIEKEPGLDLAKAMERKDRVINGLRKGVEALFKRYKLSLIKGTAKLSEKDKVIVKTDSGEKQIGASAFLIATGASPMRIPLFPIDGEKILSSDHLFNLKQVPKSIVIIGAGAIGLEWAFILKEFGSEVSVVEMLSQALPNEDEMLGEILAREMRKKKIGLLVNEKIIELKKNQKEVIVRTESGKELKAEKLLVSIGSSPNSRGLGLESIGVETDARGFIKVNNRLESSVPGIYSAGDVAGGMLLAHKASAEAKVAVSNALGKKQEMDYSVIPTAIFTQPEVASVGLKEQEAKQKRINYQTAGFSFRGLGRAQAMGEIAGEIKLIFEKETLKLLGCHIIGANASDLIHEASLAINLGASIKDLAHTIHAHPTLSEGLMEAGEAGLGIAIHQPKAKAE